MSRLNRRQLLQFTGGAIGALGFNQWRLSRQATHYGKALAQPTPQKLALLVGIDQYRKSEERLRGAVTDVELQYHLLVHRFGFQPSDIKILTDESATRENILETFVAHLIEQAQPGDVVVFHYSGHGGTIGASVCPDSSRTCSVSTIVPVNYGSSRFDNSPVIDIRGETLFLMMSALKTHNVTMIFDCCYAGGVRKFRARSTGNPSTPPPISVDEIDYQRAWIDYLGWPIDKVIENFRGEIEKGVLLYAAEKSQLAIDFDFTRTDGTHSFSAGAFTYLLTRYLWQRTQPTSIDVVLPPVTAHLRRLLRDSNGRSDDIPQPTSNPKEADRIHQNSIYYTPFQTGAAAAVVTQVDDNQVELWLGGIDAHRLIAFGEDAIFTEPDTATDIKLESRKGFRATGIIQPSEDGSVSALPLGAILQEKSSIIPENIQVSLSLDGSLSEDEVIHATEQLQRINIINLSTENQGATATLGRLQPEDLEWSQLADQIASEQTATNPIPAINSLGLFTVPQHYPLLGSFGIADETIEDGVHRLRSKFKQLLINDLLRMLINQEASTLTLQVDISTRADSDHDWGPPIQTVATAPIQTVATANAADLEDSLTSSLISERLISVAVGTHVKISIHNKDSQDLYVCVLVIDPLGQADVIFPLDWGAPDEETRVKHGEMLTVPSAQVNDDLKMQVTSPSGLNEVLVIASNRPLRQARQTFQRVADRRRNSFNLSEPTAIFHDIFSDLSNPERSDRVSSSSLRKYQIDAEKLAVLSLAFMALEET